MTMSCLTEIRHSPTKKKGKFNFTWSRHSLEGNEERKYNGLYHVHRSIFVQEANTWRRRRHTFEFLESLQSPSDCSPCQPKFLSASGQTDQLPVQRKVSIHPLRAPYSSTCLSWSPVRNRTAKGEKRRQESVIDQPKPQTHRVKKK